MPTKRNTAEKIRESLIKLLQTKQNPDDITATELCETAEINRATFYYHYNSVQDVFSEIELQVEREFGAFLSQSPIFADGVPDRRFYVRFFDFVGKHAEICRTILGNSSHSFLNQALESGRYKVLGEMSRLFPDCPASKINYYYVFVSNGFLGLVQYWLNNGMKESPQDIAEVGEHIANGGLVYLK